MTTRLLQGFLLAAGFALAGCASTALSESWIDPSVETLPGFRKVFVVYRGADASVQRVAEDALAAHIRAPEVVRCYSLFPDASALGPEEIKSRLRAQGFDAAVVMRVAGVEQEVSWTPSAYPSHSRSFGSYWGGGYDPGTMRTDEIVHVETNLYALLEDKLLYAARSETFNPGSTAKLVDEIAAEVADDLEERGVLRPHSR
jgi:hypothetical protein